MQMRFVDPSDTTVGEVHEMICDTAVEIANTKVSQNASIPKKWRGSPFMNGSPYNGGRLVLEIINEYHLAPVRIKQIYRTIAIQSLQEAIVRHQDLFAGLILGSAKNGHNYFDQWPQVPTQL